MDTRKYIFEKGIMKINPAYAHQVNQAQGAVVVAPSNALAIVSSTQDIMQASEAKQMALGHPMELSEATTASIQIMQDNDFLNQFQARGVDGGELLDGLSNIFAKYEVPIGLVNKLLALSEYKLNFIIDDSGSMSNFSDMPLYGATQYVKQKYDPHRNRENSFNNKMTRWEEAEDRVHVMLDMLAFIPCNTITINFLNTNKQIILEHRGKTPEQFAIDAHNEVSQKFKLTGGGTPIKNRLEPALLQSTTPTMHYLFTDGVPTDIGIPQLKQIVLNRPNPHLSPLTFMSCTENDSEAEWMKEIEELAPYTAELDDYESEKKEVLNDQGPGFPFSKGFWLLCQLVAAINPDDLDALDESVPFTKQTMDNLMGRKLTIEEYDYYFQNNPNAKQYMHLRHEFAREDRIAREIIPKKNAPQATGYYSGMPNQNPTYSSTTNYPPGNLYPSAPPLQSNSNYSSTGTQNNHYNASNSSAAFWNNQAKNQSSGTYHVESRMNNLKQFFRR